MKPTLIAVWLVAATAASAPAPALAQDTPAATPAPDEPTKTRTGKDGKVKFYDFDELLVGGELRAPNAYFASARQRIRWGRLLRLKRSFVKLLLATDKYPILRNILTR